MFSWLFPFFCVCKKYVRDMRNDILYLAFFLFYFNEIPAKTLRSNVLDNFPLVQINENFLLYQMKEACFPPQLSSTIVLQNILRFNVSI